MVRRMTEVKKSRKNFDLEKSRLEHNQKLNQMVLQMIKRADDAKCYISGLKDFRNQETGATLAHCLATYGLHLALETVIENDAEVVHLADNSGFTLLHCAAKFGQVEVHLQWNFARKSRSFGQMFQSLITIYSALKFLFDMVLT